METGFHSVPPEVLNIILSLLDRSALKSLRRVNKSFASRLTPLLFSDLEVWLQAQSLSRLISIANHNALSQHVQSLTITNDFITGDVLAPSTFIETVYSKVCPQPVQGTGRGTRRLDPESASCISLESFVEMGFLPFMKYRKWLEELKTSGWHPERLFSAWKLQRDLAIEHAQFLCSGKDVEALTEALKRFPNISSVRLSADGIGGPRKLTLNGVHDYFSQGAISRVDGRQLSVFILAAGAAASLLPSPTSNYTTIKSFVIDGEFWIEEDGMYTGPDRRHHPGIITLVPRASLSSALPFLSNVTTLTLPFRDKNTDQKHREIEANLTLFLASVPKLEHLTFFNSGFKLLQLRQPLLSLTTKWLRTLNLQLCVLHLGGTQKLLCTYSTTLKTVHLENIELLGGHFVDLFSSLRNITTLGDFSIKGWVVEVEDDEEMYFYRDQKNKKVFYESKKRRNLAREAIKAFVLRQREEFPTELLDVDSSRISGSGEGTGGTIVVVGASKLWDSEEIDY